MRDIISILEQTGIYWQGEHNKSSNEFTFNGHMIEFLSVDEPQKIRGRKRNIAFLNEANELTLEDFRQINMRTTDFVIMDFNPSDPVHWIYEEIISREDCDTWITTYKDNKFLQADIIKEIERMRERDPDYWRVYGEGQQAVFSKRQIFNNWTFIPRSEFPPLKEIALGIDFGFTTDPTAIVEVSKVNDKIYLNEVLYKREMTNQDIAQFLKDNNYQETLCFPDSAEPKSVEELRRQGIWAKEAIKGAGSVNAGISLLKEFDIYVSLESKNILKEYRGYTWTELKDGTIINKPVDKNNHAMDAIRYGVYSQYSKRTEFFVI
jgi:phage terminase large subunit